MKPGGGKEKGAGFEGYLLAPFQQWWGRGKFIRTKNMQVVGTDSRLAHSDIACMLETVPPCLDNDFPFSVEAKKDECWSFLNFYRKATANPLDFWWQQCIDDAARWGKDPLLVFSKNYHPIFTARRPTLRFTTIEQVSVINPAFHCMLKGEPVIIRTLDIFFAQFKPKHAA